MKEYKKHIINFLKGIAIGGAMFVPGVSGGTTALILGVYDEMISSVSNIFKQFKKSIIFLIPLGLGGIIGIIAVAKLINLLLENWEMPTMFFFLGAVLGSLPMLIKKAKIKKFTYINLVWSLIWILLGGAIVFSFKFLPQNLFSFSETLSISSVALFILAGIIISIAFVLPGISTSYMLLVLGMYTSTTNAISEMDFGYLIPLVICIAIGTLLTVRILEISLKKQPTIMYLLIIGFMLGSIIEVFPGIPSNWDIFFSVLTLAAGAYLIYFLAKKEGQDDAKQVSIKD